MNGLIFQELESERVKLMEDVQSNKKKMKELEDNLLYRLTSTKVMVNFSLLCSLINYYYWLILIVNTCNCINYQILCKKNPLILIGWIFNSKSKSEI